MKQKIAMMWADALDSGDYQQTTGQLRELAAGGVTDGFCCLGVLCNLHAQDHPRIAAAQQDSEKYLGASTSLPEQVACWAGMAYLSGRPRDLGEIVIGSQEYGDLADANDEGVMFSDIAAYIRKNWRKL